MQSRTCHTFFSKCTCECRCFISG